LHTSQIPLSLSEKCLIVTTPLSRLAARLAGAILLTCGLVQTAHADSKAIDRAVKADMAESGAPGAVVVLTRGNITLYAKAFGIARAGERMTLSHEFRVGSLSKLVTATAVATAAAKGLLELGVPIGRLDGDVPADLKSLTLTELLNQCSGLRDEPGADGPKDPRSFDAFIRGLSRGDFIAKPGESFSYSNVGYALAGHVLASRTHESFESAVRHLVLDPLGMRDTFYDGHERASRPLADGFVKDAKGTLQRVSPYTDDRRLRPAGYAYSTASDLTRLAQAIMAAQRGARSAIAGQVARAVTTPRCRVDTRILRPDTAYAFALFANHIDGDWWYEHAGEMPGFTGEMTFVPDTQVSLVVLTNFDGPRFLRTRAAALQLAGLDEAPAPAEPIRAAKQIPPDLAGHYRNRGTLDVSVKSDHLEIAGGPIGDAPLAFYPVGPDRFTPGSASGAGPMAVFHRDGRGRPVGVDFILWRFCKTDDRNRCVELH
jgi:CubicO group peptidase (beta-lactamase class C family)